MEFEVNVDNPGQELAQRVHLRPHTRRRVDVLAVLLYKRKGVLQFLVFFLIDVNGAILLIWYSIILSVLFILNILNKEDKTIIIARYFISAE